jgi:hypothetical protein
MQPRTWKACGLSTHWNKHVAGLVPEAHPTKHCTSSRQPGDVTQESSCPQHASATQSPQAFPVPGQATSAQLPFTQLPSQHGVPKPQASPVGAQLDEQLPASQPPSQQSASPSQLPPSVTQASTQTPPSQVPLQQSAPT